MEPKITLTWNEYQYLRRILEDGRQTLHRLNELPKPPMTALNLEADLGDALVLLAGKEPGNV